MLKVFKNIRKYLLINKSVKSLKSLGKESHIGNLPRPIIGAHLISIGNHVCVEEGARLAVYDKFKNIEYPCSSIKIGDNTYINQYFTCLSADKLVIGDNCLIASFVFISNFNHSIFNPEELFINQPLVTSPVIIEDNVWIGEKTIILPGVHIGSNSIIGAGSVVTKDIPEYSIAVGNPARVIKKYVLDDKKWVRI